MKILFDHQKFSMQKYGGITKYFCELMERIPQNHEFELSVLSSDNYYLKQAGSTFNKPNLLPSQDFKGKNFLKNRIYGINEIYSKYCIKYNEYDLFHPTYYDDYFLKSLKKPFVITVHDLIHFKFQHSYFKDHSVRDQMEKIIKKATRIISISEHTKNDICQIINIQPDKIDVIHHGFNQSETSVRGDNRWGEYILYVGERNYYKNFTYFIEAVQPLLARNKTMKVICVGPALTKEESSILISLGIFDQVVAMHVDNATLSDLYFHAQVFVYPSLYEGFGLPILEAFANDCPVCLSDASCFPEIAAMPAVTLTPKIRTPFCLPSRKCSPILR